MGRFGIIGLVGIVCISLRAGADIIPGYQHPPIFLSVPSDAITATGKDNLSFYFSPNEELCRKEYGENYYIACNPDLGNEGKITTGIKLSPAMNGTWRWVGDYYISFSPKSYWEPGTTYTVTLEKSLYPAYVAFNKTTFQVKTDPLEATIEHMAFLQDPQNPDKKLISAKVRFNYPINPESFEKACGFRYDTGEKPDPKKKAPAAKKLPLKFTYTPDWMEATVVATLEELPAKDSPMLMEIAPGLLPQTGTKGTEKIFQERVEIPSLAGYLKVKSANTTIVPDAKGLPQQVLALNLSVKTTGAELDRRMKVYLLPEHHPIEKNAVKKTDEPHVWRHVDEINAAVEDEMESITLKPLGSEKDAEKNVTDLHTFSYTQKPGRYLYVVVDKGVKSFGGYTLTKPFRAIVPVSPYPKEVEILQKGSLLSLAGDKKLSIQARGQKELRFQIAQVLPQFINNLVTQTHGSFSNPSFEEYGETRFNTNYLAEVTTQDVTLDLKSDRESQYTTFDFSKYLSTQKRGLFFFSANSKEKTKDGKERIGTQSDKRFVLVTDLGFLVKINSDNTEDLFILSLREGLPVEGAQVRVLGANGLPVFEGVSSKNGHLVLPNLSTLEGDKKPVAYVVTKGDDLSFMPYSRDDRTLNYSNFPTEGTYFGPTGLKAYLFSDRGLYRPGEKVQVGMIVKSHDWTKDLTGMPLHLIVRDPKGSKVHDQVVTLNTQGFLEAAFTPDRTAPTGKYTFSLHLDGEGKESSLLNSTQVTVEDFLPDTLRLTSQFNNETKDAWVSTDGLEAHITLMNLYGTPATNRRVSATMTLTAGAFYFKEFPDYVFFDATANTDKELTSPLSDQATDANGKTTFKLDLSRFEKASYNLSLTLRGYEADGGRGVGMVHRLLVSPLKYVVGAKTKGALRLQPNDQKSIEFIALNPQLKRISVGNLKAVLFKTEPVNTLVQKEDGSFTYEAVPTDKKISTKEISLSDKGTAYPLDTKQGGDFVLTLQNDAGATVAKIPYTVLGGPVQHMKGDNLRQVPLEIKLDKDSYGVDDTLEVHISSPYTGAGLLTIESDRVLAYKFFQAKGKEFVEKIDLPKNFVGKGYVNVALVRGLDSQEVYLSPLTYGIKPFTAGIETKKYPLSLKVPDGIKPGVPFEVQYASKIPGKVILFGVDEGILQAANYATPNPLKYLLQDRALEVETDQIFDLLMPEHTLLKKISAYGGDGEMRMAAALRKKSGASHLNPFARQVIQSPVFWSGLLDIGPEEKSHKVTLPDHFNGSLRVMAVAVSADRTDSETKDVTVQGDIIISPSLPQFAAPGDTFESVITIANNLEKDGDKPLPMTVKVSDNLKLMTQPPATFEVAPKTEKNLVLKLAAQDQLGEGFLEITVAGVTRRETLSIRPALARQTITTGGILKAGESKTLGLTQDFHSALRTQTVSVSALPMAMIQGLVAFLDNYPYGCTEQLLSRAFPGVLLMDLPDYALKADVLQKELDAVVGILRARQNGEGGFSRWDHGPTDPFVTLYALDFMTQALEKKIPVPQDLMEKTLAYARVFVNKSAKSLDDGRVKSYGIYLLTRNGEVTTNYLINLMTDLEKFHKDTWRQDLSALYIAATYKLMLQEEAGQKLVDGFDPLGQKNVYGYDFYGPLAKHSQYISLLARHFPDSLKTMKPEVLNQLASTVGSGSYATFSSVYGIGAIVDYTKALGNKPETTAAIAVLDGASKPLTIKPEGTLSKMVTLPSDTATVNFKADKNLLFYQLAQSGFPKNGPKEAIHKGIEVTRTYTDLTGKPITTVTLGQEIVVTVTLRSAGQNTQENVAVVDLFPAGFDLIRDKVGLDGSSLRPDAVDKRADRLVLYATALPGDAFSYVYHLRAVTKGTFVLPGIYGESMYNPTVVSTGPTGTLTVTGP